MLVQALVTFHGPGVTVTAGDLHDDSDPIVKIAPDNFAPVASMQTGRTTEAATAAPGEQRNAKRPTQPQPK